MKSIFKNFIAKWLCLRRQKNPNRWVSEVKKQQPGMQLGWVVADRLHSTELIALGETVLFYTENPHKNRNILATPSKVLFLKMHPLNREKKTQL